jgi:hypothetical protein
MASFTQGLENPSRMTKNSFVAKRVYQHDLAAERCRHERGRVRSMSSYISHRTLAAK